MTTIRGVLLASKIMPIAVRAAFATATVLATMSVVPLAAGAIIINYSGTGQLTFITAPGGAASQDSFSATIADATLGNGTLQVIGDVTDYATGTGSSGPGSAVFSFGMGTFSGSTASLLNLANGQDTITYTITNGTGAFAGYSGTVVESAQFTSQGSFSPNVPANVTITGATGTLVAGAPEPSTVLTGLLGGVALMAGTRLKRRTWLRAIS